MTSLVKERYGHQASQDVIEALRNAAEPLPLPEDDELFGGVSRELLKSSPLPLVVVH